MSRFWLGADPGGKGHFGLAFLPESAGAPDLKTVSSVDDAVAEVLKTGTPLGIGIDAPMWWSTDQAARRQVDKEIRAKYGISSGTVQSPNSLKGAALIGGMMLAYRVRQQFPDILITESHPKALREADRRKNGELLKDLGYVEPEKANEHQRDALLAAICAREGFENRWSADLAEDRWPSEQDPLSPCYWLGPVHYYWPEKISGSNPPV